MPPQLKVPLFCCERYHFSADKSGRKWAVHICTVKVEGGKATVFLKPREL